MRSDFSLDSPSKVSSHSCKYLEDNICRPTSLLFSTDSSVLLPLPCHHVPSHFRFHRKDHIILLLWW